VYGVFYAVFPLMPGLWAAAPFVTLAHLGGGAQWALSTYGLQRIVPDHIRGRVMSFDYGFVTLTLGSSILLAGWAADHIDPRIVMVVLASVAVAYSAVWSTLTTSIRRQASLRGAGV
jgi:MFS family permease